MAQEAVTVREISPEDAAARLRGLEARDPRGLLTAEDLVPMARACRCFELSGPVQAVYLLQVANGCAWVEAAQGQGGADLTALLDGVITAQAEQLESLGCMTERPGLVRKLKQHGWRVSGWVLKKDLKNAH